MNASVRIAHVVITVLVLSLALSFVSLGGSPASNPPAEPAKATPGAAAANPAPQSGPAVEPAKEPPVVVAKIGDYTVTKSDLARRLMDEIRPHSEEYTGPKEPVTANTMLLQMVAEKAMMMEGRKLGYLDDEMIHFYVQRQKQQKLGAMVVIDYVRQNLSITDADVDQMMKANPKLTRDQATQLARRNKGNAMLEQHYRRLLEKFHAKMATENYAKAAQIHDRLLLKPATPRKESWILLSQVKTELTPEEKAIPLATYDGGRFTLLDLFDALHQMSPPSRPKDLGTPEGIGRFLDRALRPSILVAEAQSRGFDKDAQFLREIRELEDRCLLDKVLTDKVLSAPEPTDEQIQAYFEKNKERFGENPTLKVDQVWCKSLSAARKAREMLDGGATFEATKSACSIQKDVQAHNIYPGGEGPFWADLWKGEPNQVVGPIKGFYGEGLAWRLVKILEKKPGQPKAYSDQVKSSVKWAVIEERRNAALDSYRKELLEKYPHEVYADKIEGINPLNIPEPNEVAK